MEAERKRFTWLCVMFCILILVFFVLHETHIMTNLSAYICVTYITYFAGIALYFNAKQLNTKSKDMSSKLCMVFSIILIILSIGFIVYGVVTEEIPFFAI